MHDEVGELLGHTASVLQFLGLWPGSATWRGVLVLLVNAAVPPMPVSKLCLEPTDSLEELALELLVVISSLTFTVKVAAFLGQKKRAKNVAQMLAASRRRFTDGKLADDVARECYRRRIVRIIASMQVTLAVPCFLWLVEPLAHSGTGTSKRLPWPMWLPKPLRASPAYEVIYVIQAVMMISAVEASLYIDVYFVVLMLCVRDELRVLNDRISSISAAEIWRSTLKSGLKAAKEMPMAEPDSSREANTLGRQHTALTLMGNTHGGGGLKEMYDEVVQNVRHHQLIITCAKELQLTMSQSFFVLLSMNMMNICIHIFVGTVLLQKDVEHTTLAKLVCSLPICTFETALYCVLGQMIIDQGDQLASSAFSGGWPDGEVRVRRVVLVFMLRASRPLNITVGKMYVLSRHTFLQVLNASYTLFNMLYQIQSNK